MKKSNVLILLAFVFFACRKDNSTILAPSTSTGANGDKCLIIKSNGTLNNATVKYQLDSIISELNTGIPSETLYLIQETPKKFLCAKGSKELKNVEYRLYLNSDGAVEKEIKVILNSDGKTFTEDPSSQNLYTYNSKKQLIEFRNRLSGDPGDAFLEYDEKNRIKEILVYDENDVLFFRYKNFVHSDVPINNNLFEVGLSETLGAYFIPSLRNTYVTHYETDFPDFDLGTDTFDFEYKFKNGMLYQVSGKYVVYGIPFEYTNNFTFSCK